MCFKHISTLAWKCLVTCPKLGSQHYKCVSGSPWRYRNVFGSCSVRSQPLWLHWRTCCTPYKRILSLGPRTPYLWKAPAGWLRQMKATDALTKMNPLLPTGLCGLNGGRGELSLLGDAAFTFSFTCRASLFGSSAAFFAVSNKMKDETFSTKLLQRFTTAYVQWVTEQKKVLFWSSLS